MLRVRRELEVLRVVVLAVAVPVVDDFVSDERAAEDSLHDDVVKIAPDRAIGCASFTSSPARIRGAKNYNVAICVDSFISDLSHSSLVVELPECLGGSSPLVGGPRRSSPVPVPPSADLGVPVGLAALRDGGPECRRVTSASLKFGLTWFRAGETGGPRGWYEVLSAANRTDNFNWHLSILS
jgi:hypothetical protein